MERHFLLVCHNSIPKRAQTAFKQVSLVDPTGKKFRVELVNLKQGNAQGILIGISPRERKI